MKIHLKSILLTTAVLALVAAPALADKKGRGGGHGGSHHEQDYDVERHHSSGHNNDDGYHIAIPNVIVIGGDDRDILREYLRAQHGKLCPPGLAKKHNGCLPPGQAKKYRIGARLPDDVMYRDLPYDLLHRLGRPPAGYQYVQVDKDVLLIGEATKKVVDAVTLLSAVGR